MTILEINNLSKRYGRIMAVNDLSLTVESGNIYGMLGPNGSGKTTTLGMVLGITKATKGEFTWFDGQVNDSSARLRIGALLETPNFYPYLNAIDNLGIIAHIKRVKEPKLDELLHLVNLYERRNSSFRTYSLGMKQRLAIAAAMVGDPEVLIFDEPTNGLDPQGIAEVRETLKTIAGQGKTIIMASHILDEVEKICSHVAILKRGNLLATGTVGAIISNDKTIEVGADDLEALKSLLSGISAISRVDVDGSKLVLSVDPEFGAAELNRLAYEKGLVLNHLVGRQRSLESEFLEITKEA